MAEARPDSATAGPAVTQPQRATDNRFGGQESKGAQKSQPVPLDDGNTLDVRPKPPRWTPPTSDPKYIDNAIKSVSLSGSGYVLHWIDKKGVEYTTTVPDGWIVRTHDRVTFVNSATVYRTRQEALEALTPQILQNPGRFRQYIGLWSNERFPFVVPTMFSDVSTPKIMAAIEAKDEQMRRAALQAEEEMRGVAIGMLEGKALQLAYQGAWNPRLYNRFDPPKSAPAGQGPSSAPTTLTAPPAAGATNPTPAPASGSTSGTRPPVPGATSKTPTPQASPSQRSTTLESKAVPAPPAPSAPPAGILESRGASLMPASFQSASAKTPRSVITSVRSDVAESQGYIQALIRGEIGLQRPSGSNLPGPDFITARVNPQTGVMEILVNDMKLSTVGRFPTPANQMPASWMAETQAAIAPGRLDLGNPALEAQIQQAFLQGNVRLRQLNADYSPAPTGQGRITGW
jgi:hypothetical protein